MFRRKTGLSNQRNREHWWKRIHHVQQDFPKNPKVASFVRNGCAQSIEGHRFIAKNQSVEETLYPD